MGSVDVDYDARGKNPSVSKIRWKQLGKRLIDLTVSTIGLAILTPFFPILWVAVRLDSPGPVIFKQKRVGQYGRLFVCLKIRTMYHNADETFHRKAIEKLWFGEKLSQKPNSQYKLTNDPRITRIGRLLRQTSVDELPQLLNVLRGEMSIVGPRPAIPYELKYYKDLHHERHMVKPGITGLWQVRGRGGISVNEMLDIDVEYARTWSLWLDLKLIALSIPIVLKAHGAG